MEHQVAYVGIDVSKVRADVAVRPSGDGWSVSYDESGVAVLVVHLQAMNPASVLLEASGAWKSPPVSALAAAALPVVVVNPRQVRDCWQPAKLAHFETREIRGLIEVS